MREKRLFALIGMALAKNIEQENEKDVVSWLILVVKLFVRFLDTKILSLDCNFLICFNQFV